MKRLGYMVSGAVAIFFICGGVMFTQIGPILTGSLMLFITLAKYHCSGIPAKPGSQETFGPDHA